MPNTTQIDVYHKWILACGIGKGETTESATLRMQKIFPELRRFHGSFLTPGGGLKDLWWLKWVGVVIDMSSGHFFHYGTQYVEGREVKP